MMPQWSSFSTIVPFSAIILTIQYLWVPACREDYYVRGDFPADFVFGCGTSAYQVEGAAFEDGRTPSIWDTFVQSCITDEGNGDIACDTYHKHKEDVKIMAEMGLEAYRFSISWSKLIPNGRGPLNPKGLQYYNNLINELIRHGIQPHVTLFHVDTPQAREDEYGGWLSRKIEGLHMFADACFKEFGDRVLYRTTLNEPNIFALGGYDYAQIPPGRCSFPFGTFVPMASQHGFLGINIYTFGFVPYTDSTADIVATQRANDYYIGWLVNPLIYGDYPDIMTKNGGNRIPVFTPAESKLIKGRYGVLVYFKQVYRNPLIYIQENGQRIDGNGTLNDGPRVQYLHAYIGAVLDAVRNGSNTKGYFLWSFLNGYELLDGFKSSYGLYYFDLDDKELKRYPKLSAAWYSNFLKGSSSTIPDGHIDAAKCNSVL